MKYEGSWVFLSVFIISNGKLVEADMVLTDAFPDHEDIVVQFTIILFGCRRLNDLVLVCLVVPAATAQSDARFKSSRNLHFLDSAVICLRHGNRWQRTYGSARGHSGNLLRRTRVLVLYCLCDVAK
jgi:hypothetical protein